MPLGSVVRQNTICCSPVRIQMNISFAANVLLDSDISTCPSNGVPACRFACHRACHMVRTCSKYRFNLFRLYIFRSEYSPTHVIFFYPEDFSCNRTRSSRAEWHPKDNPRYTNTIAFHPSRVLCTRCCFHTWFAQHTESSCHGDERIMLISKNDTI